MGSSQQGAAISRSLVSKFIDELLIALLVDLPPVHCHGHDLLLALLVFGLKRANDCNVREGWWAWECERVAVE